MSTARSHACQIQLYAETVPGPVRWRLLNGNNREAGRGAQPYPDAEACRLAVKELQIAVDELEPFVRRTNSSTWTWELMRGAELIASSGRAFDRLIRCEQGLAQFRVRLADAEFSPAVMVSEARRWRTTYS